MARKARGSKRCGAKCKSTGKPCRAWALTGTKRCTVHGVGTRKRVERGTRKPPGRPPITGNYCDPERTHYGRLSELLEQAKADSASLRTTDHEMAIVKAVLAWQWERLLAGDWDVMKTADLMEHPATWFIECAGSIVDRVVKANNMISKDRLQALLALVEPIITLVISVVNEYVPTETREAAQNKVRSLLATVLVPVPK
jgi:hypothetical protein